MDAVTPPHPVSRIHGGPGPAGPARFDFSTTANACGPCPLALAAVREADRSHYPDPAYTALKSQLAAFHGVAAGRVVLAASASEFIFRLTAVTAVHANGPVTVPVHAFGDYATAARGYGRPVLRHGDAGSEAATLVWHTDPGSPLGNVWPPLGEAVPPSALLSEAVTVVDRACEPLRLSGHSAWGTALDGVFQLWSPNKALGLTGVRAAYALAPDGAPAAAWAQRLEAACPSWPLGAEGVALLQAWVSPAVQAWVAASRDTLRTWKAQQTQALQALGWQVLPSVTNFNLLRPPAHGVGGTGATDDRVTAVHSALAAEGVAWRHTASFGLPGAWRVSVQAPPAQAAMLAAVGALT
jgi:histidinol-phosphate aminotransferase